MAGTPREITEEELVALTEDDALLAVDVETFREVTHAEAVLMQQNGQAVEILPGTAVHDGSLVTSLPGARSANLDANNGEALFRLGSGNARVEATMTDYSGSADQVYLYTREGNRNIHPSREIGRLLKKRDASGKQVFFTKPPQAPPARNFLCDYPAGCRYHGATESDVDQHFRTKHPTEYQLRQRDRDRRHQDAVLATQQANLAVMSRLAGLPGAENMTVEEIALTGASLPDMKSSRRVIIEWAERKGLPYGPDEVALDKEALLIRYGLLELEEAV